MKCKNVNIIISSIMIILIIAVGSFYLVKKNSVSTGPSSIEREIKLKIKEYVKEYGKKYSENIVSGNNSFFVGGIGKNLNEYEVENFKPEDFDIRGLIESVPDNCEKFEAEINIDDSEILINIYTEKDKFYEETEG